MRFVPYWIVITATLFIVTSLGVTGWAYFAVVLGLVLSCVSGQHIEYRRTHPKIKKRK